MSSVFTAPKFLSMPAVGLDISSDAVRFIELTNGRDGLQVSRWSTHNFPMGIIAEGHVRDKKKIRDVIAGFAKDYALTFANIALPEEQAYLANMRIPRVSQKEIHDVVELRLEEHVPIPASDAIFDFVVVGDDAAKGKEEMDVVVSALPRSAVEEYLEIFSDTGIIPKAFEFESQAMARAIIPRGDNGTFLVADIGKVDTNVFVVANGIVQFSVSLDIGGHNLTRAIEILMKVSYQEAEELKVKFGLLGGEKETTLHGAMMPIIADLRTRLMHHYSYWQTHHAEKAGGNIECIYLTGGGANLKGAEEYLAQGLEVKVVVANPWINVRALEGYVPPLTLQQSHGYSAAIGLALRNTFLS